MRLTSTKKIHSSLTVFFVYNSIVYGDLYNYLKLFPPATSGTKFRMRSSQSLFSNFHCYGNESSPIDCLHSSSSCTYSGRVDAAVSCAGDIVSGNVCWRVYTIILSHVHLHHSSHTMQGVAFKKPFVWLVPMVPTQLKEEWSTAVMECGELSTAALGLTQKMVKWCVEDLDTNIRVSLPLAFLLY